MIATLAIQTRLDFFLDTMPAWLDLSIYTHTKDKQGPD